MAVEVEVCFSADEVLAVAEQIEQNGIAFYDGAAERAADPGLQRLFHELSQWEEGHRDRFASLRAQLTEQERRPVTYDPEGELDSYLKVIADGQIFGPARTPAGLLGNAIEAREIVRAAIGFEHESIAYYVSIKPRVPPRLGRAHLDAIIQEEYSHIVRLAGRLTG